MTVEPRDVERDAVRQPLGGDDRLRARRRGGRPGARSPDACRSSDGGHCCGEGAPYEQAQAAFGIALEALEQFGLDAAST